MKLGTRYLISALGLLISVGAPALTTLSFFPLWQDAGKGVLLSGFTLFLLLLAAIPLIKLLKRVLSTPSAPLVWLIIFIFFLLFEKIASEVTVIALVGTLSNLAGALLFKAAGLKRTNK